MVFSSKDFFYKGEQLLQTIWVGGLIAVGYLAAPILFNTLDDRQLAGALAGRMFSAMNVVGFVCGGALLLAALKQGTHLLAPRMIVLAVMLLILVIGAFVLQPMMQELKSLGLAENSEAAVQFGRLHGISSGLYLLNTLLGLYLVLMPRRS